MTGSAFGLVFGLAVEIVDCLRSGLTLGLFPPLWKTSLNLLAGDLPLTLDGSAMGFRVSALSTKPGSTGSGGTCCRAGDLGELGALIAGGGSIITGKASVERFRLPSEGPSLTVVVVMSGDVVVR